MNNLYKKRFDELSDQAQKIRSSAKPEFNGSNYDTNIDFDIALNWRVKAESLLVKTCGTDSPHYTRFMESEHLTWSSTLERFKSQVSVFDAAREDFEGGYLVSIHDLVQAEVFDSELEQASELLKSGYSVAAAVVAGTVLETAIRSLCSKNNIQHSKLDKMNADLAKAGAYSGLMQKRITHLAGVRNAAAHGNKEEFKAYDVGAMISEVEQFLATHLR